MRRACREREDEKMKKKHTSPWGIFFAVLGALVAAGAVFAWFTGCFDKKKCFSHCCQDEDDVMDELDDYLDSGDAYLGGGAESPSEE